jgi:hypothetical protein
LLIERQESVEEGGSRARIDYQFQEKDEKREKNQKRKQEEEQKIKQEDEKNRSKQQQYQVKGSTGPKEDNKIKDE